MELAKTKAKWIVPQCWRTGELASASPAVGAVSAMLRHR